MHSIQTIFKEFFIDASIDTKRFGIKETIFEGTLKENITIPQKLLEEFISLNSTICYVQFHDQAFCECPIIEELANPHQIDEFTRYFETHPAEQNGDEVILIIPEQLNNALFVLERSRESGGYRAVLFRP
jgi:hypothetical protein